MMVNVIAAASSTAVPIDILSILEDKKILCQFLLDCTSLNLDNNIRVNVDDPAAREIFRQSRKLVAAIHAERMRRLKDLERTRKPNNTQS